MSFDLPSILDRERLEPEVVLDERRGAFVTSRLNRASAIGAQAVGRSVVIHDDTLRSGANTPGVYATTAQKLRIAQALEEAGVSEVEAGYATIAEHLEFVRELKRTSAMRLSGHFDYYGDGWQDRVQRGLEAGFDIVNLMGMAGYLMSLALHPHLVGEAVNERIYEAASFAKAQGAFTSIGTIATTLTEFEGAVRAALAAGADRFYVYDARGWHTPEVMAFLTRFVRDVAGDAMQVAIHCHDDFGLATANSIAAVLAGADSIDVTVLSTGHRCGNAAFEQCVAALEAIHGVDTGIRLDRLRGLCETVAAEYGVTIPANAPIVGDTMYTYGGVHTRALLDGHWSMWENVRAEAVGHERNIVFGVTALQRTSANPVMAKIRQMELTASPAQLEHIFTDLQHVVERQREASVAEMEQIIRRHVA